MATVKLRLIEEVRKRPILWDLQGMLAGRNQHEIAVMWIEIGKIVGFDGPTCKKMWQTLRLQFCSEAKRISIRIAKAKQKGEFDPNKKYYSWAFFDALKFIANGLSSRAQLDLNFENSSDMVENNNVDQIQSQFSDSNSYQTESGDDIGNVECDKSGQKKSEKQNDLETKYKSDDENYLGNKVLPKENGSPSSITPVDDSDGSKPGDTNFRPYTVSLNSGVPNNECATVSNCTDNTALQSCSFKEDPELQIDPEIHALQDANEFQECKSIISTAELSSKYSEKSNLLVESNANKRYDTEDGISKPPSINDDKHGQNGQSTLSDDNNGNSPGLNDEDYSFLYSFLSQTKAMTQLQNKEFRVNMKNLLVHIFPASASVNILEKQLLLPEDSDPDRKFLISFWPFLNSMSLTQNLQFRAKMSNLVLQISSEAIL